ncbi:MAG: CDP-2,3-bis-(O-geranylgeranyl)-sn-glycerol synthase [Hyperthermus sp.]|nr:MAG: CDP-2,3-bis-(O-geranylgeranyl)-sn-glycerol synthase [Hyperthermus sp.]
MARLLTPLETILVVLPALAANGSPVLLKGRGTPLDGGRQLLGKPLLGEGKTVEGTLLGLATGSTVALLLAALYGSLALAFMGFISSLGGLAGDIVAAFIKRRLGLRRGEPAPVLDQLDFYAGSLLALYAAGVVVDLYTALLMAPLIYVLHRATNIAAHRKGLKKVPW